jgi:hypothetical protein
MTDGPGWLHFKEQGIFIAVLQHCLQVEIVA